MRAAVVVCVALAVMLCLPMSGISATYDYGVVRLEPPFGNWADIHLVIETPGELAVGETGDLVVAATIVDNAGLEGIYFGQFVIYIAGDEIVYALDFSDFTVERKYSVDDPSWLLVHADPADDNTKDAVTGALTVAGGYAFGLPFSFFSWLLGLFSDKIEPELSDSFANLNRIDIWTSFFSTSSKAESKAARALRFTFPITIEAPGKQILVLDIRSGFIGMSDLDWFNDKRYHVEKTIWLDGSSSLSAPTPLSPPNGAVNPARPINIVDKSGQGRKLRAFV